jgi:hypothetical protein
LIVAGAGSLLLWGDGEMDIWQQGHSSTTIYILEKQEYRNTPPGIQNYT